MATSYEKRHPPLPPLWLKGSRSGGEDSSIPDSFLLLQDDPGDGSSKLLLQDDPGSETEGLLLQDSV